MRKQLYVKETRCSRNEEERGAGGGGGGGASINKRQNNTKKQRSTTQIARGAPLCSAEKKTKKEIPDPDQRKYT